MLAEVSERDVGELRALVLEQRVRGLCDQNLAAVAGGRHARAAVHREPHVALLRDPRLARVDADANVDARPVRPFVRGKCALSRDGCPDGIGRRPERNQKGIALGVDLLPSFPFEDRSEKALVLDQNFAVLTTKIA